MNDIATLEQPKTQLSADKRRLAESRERARRLLEGGATGLQTAAALSQAVDAFVVELYRRELARLSLADQARVEKQAAIVAIGGTARGDIAPHSDLDLLFVFRPPVRQTFQDLAGRLVRSIWDAGLSLGHSIRTVGETLSLARQDPEVATTLVEPRRLCGAEDLFAELQRRFVRIVVRRRGSSFVADCIRGRRNEQLKHGATSQQLQPDVKRSQGALRDLHLIRWIGFARYGTADLDSLRLQGALSVDDVRRLKAAWEFLTRVRIELHCAAGRAQDVLSRDEQLRLATERGLSDRPGRRGVELFMQEYFRHTSAVAEIEERFARRNQRPPLARRVARLLTAHRSDGLYRVGHDWIDMPPRQRKRLAGDLEAILKLYQTAALYDVDLTPEMVDAVKSAAAAAPPELTSGAAAAFVRILACTRPLGRVLRSMSQTGVLERVVPAFADVRSLLQFNQYHSYTVDEHSLRAVEAATDFDGDPGPLGECYREIRHKHILHLALLLHDLGKGRAEDHSEVGRRIAEETAARLGLTEHDAETLVFLVHKHLAMNHLGLRRNTADPEVLLPFSRQVGSPETLRMLYVLTAADLTAVGPGVWTAWKAELLAEFYDRLMVVLSGRRYEYHERQRLEAIRRHVHAAVVPLAWEDERLQGWIDRQLDALPPHYLGALSPADIAADLDRVRGLAPGEVRIDARWDAETGAVDYCVVAPPDLAEGCFHKTCGALTGRRLEILTAQICTTTDGVVLDRYRVLDRDFVGEVPPERMDEVAGTIRRALLGEAAPPAFQKRMRFDGRPQPGLPSDLPIRVTIDSETSDRATIVDVFAHDRPGLLYTITRTLYELGLSVELARISTHLDQVVDVFYVTDREGRKIADADWLRHIRDTLTARIEEFENQ
ncbi:MAG: [protein-PII] uridylyltransferase [Planctomycetes bacterium]|nr:[protein-PII] uridylyltransferase [Planctomycetota bacterium]